MSINFVSSNPNKIEAFRAHARAFGFDVHIINLNIIEPQADSTITVAESKAWQAHAVLNAPVTVEDSGFGVDALSGFPGPYSKYALATIGAAGLLKLAADLQDDERVCHFVSALAYTDGDFAMTFTAYGSGRLARTIDQTPCEEAWSDLWRIIIPDGYDKPLSGLSTQDRGAIWMDWAKESVYAQFAQWMRDGQPRES